MNTDIHINVPVTETADKPMDNADIRENVKAPDKTDKRAEKLKALREKREKAISAQNAAEKKTKDINAQIAKIEKEIHCDEVRALDNLCADKGMNYAEVTAFLAALTEKMTITEAAEMLDIKIRKVDKND